MKSHSQSCLAAIAILLLARQAHAAVTLPEESFTSPQQLAAVLLDIRQQSFDSAADRLQALLDKHGSELSRSDDDGLISVNQFFASMPPTDRAALQTTYDAKFAALANQSLQLVRAKSDYRPQDLYAVAKQFPLSHAAAVALAAASDRAGDQGDLTSARVFSKLAGASRADAIDSQTIDGPFAAAGPLPFDAPWFNLPSGFESPKLFPMGSGELAFIDGEREVLALQSDGIVAWRRRASDQSSNHRARFQLGNTNRGRLSVPAVLADITGQARIIVVCQNAQHDGNGCLTALRAGDGRLLWTSEENPVLDSVAFLGSPAIAGRYVVAVGLETAADDVQSASLQLLALDVTNGHLLWRTQLAAVNVNQRSRDLDLYRDQSPPGILGDCVVVAPNVGAVFVADLFDGQLRWVRPYRKAPIGDGAIQKYEDQRTRGRDLIAPLAWTDLLRWTCTPQFTGDVAMVAPQDTLSMLGIDINTGKLIWDNNHLPQATPVGIAGDKLILSGSEITAVDPKTGNIAWTYTPVPGSA